MITNKKKSNLHYNINLNYNEKGKELYKIIKDSFLIYIKEENNKIPGRK